MVSELSVLIPVYNQPVVPLVEALLRQAQEISQPIEIRVYDDGSDLEIRHLNSVLTAWPQVVYRELPQNIGRAAIRLLMAREARHSWLLFLDNDVLPAQPDFLGKYLRQSGRPVVSGGVAYAPDYPPETRLRWLYGINREEAPAHVRQRYPYQRIFFSNLMVQKALMLQIFTDRETNGYGHEDTFFAFLLQQQRVPVLHVDNAVYHLGLEKASVFLRKTEQGVANLFRLHRKYGLAADAKLVRAYEYCVKTRVTALISVAGSWLVPLLRVNLLSRYPSLKVLDLYKLLMYHKQQKLTR